MALKNYVDRVGPLVSAAWLNQVDRLIQALAADSAGNLTLTSPSVNSPLTIIPPSPGIALIAGKLIVEDDGGLTATATNLYSQGANAFAFGTQGNAAAAWYTNGSARVSVSATGNVTVNAPSTGDGLVVNTSPNTADVGVRVHSLPTNDTVVRVAYYADASTNNVYQSIFTRNSNAGTSALNSLELSTDVVGHELLLWNTSDGFTATFGGVTGPAAGMWSLFRPLYFSVGVKPRLKIDTTGAISVLAPDSGVALTLSGVANANTLVVNGASTSGQSFGLVSRAGTTTADYSALFQSFAGTSLLQISGNGDLQGRGVALCKFKAAITSRASSTTLTNDPDLAVALVAGTYKFSCLAMVSQGGAGAIGIGLNINYSGTVTGATSYAVTTTRNAAAGFIGGVELSVSATVNNPLITAANVATIAGTDYFQFEGVLTCTTAGTLALAWGQNSSSATATSLAGGSCLTVTQLS